MSPIANHRLRFRIVFTKYEKSWTPLPLPWLIEGDCQIWYSAWERERSDIPPWKSQDTEEEREEEEGEGEEEGSKETDAESSLLLEVNVAEGRALQNRKVEQIENVFIGSLWTNR